MIFDTLEKRKYVKEYDTSANIPEHLIDQLLQKAWKVTPSKNNFMPYTVHVLGPEHQKYKDLVYLNCAGNEVKSDNVTIKEYKQRYQNNLPNYANILSCSYLLIFTMRLETNPNPFQKRCIDQGNKFEAVTEEKLNDLYPIASLEVGLFTDAFSALCLENDIDVSFTGCFHRDVSKWNNIPFVKRKPIILMTVGKAKVYREDLKKYGLYEDDLRPDYNRIVKWQ